MFSPVRCRLVLLIVLACFFPAAQAGAGETTTTSLDFIYVNANTGEAAGGHTALRIGSTVFHYQFFSEGRFLLVRDSWSHFRYVYNELRNRSIYVARLALSPQVYALLKGHFTRLLMARQQDLYLLYSAENQLSLLRQLADGTSAQLKLDTVGLFDSGTTGDVAMMTLRRNLAGQLGDLWLREQQVQVEQRLATMQVDRLAELQDLLYEQEFFRLLATGAPLASSAVLPFSPELHGLTVGEKQVLQSYRKQLLGSIICLLNSHRPDRARSLLLQTARYLLLSRSLATDTLLTLDPFSARAVFVQPPAESDLRGMLVQVQRDAERSRRNFFQEIEHPDIAYAVLETVQGRRNEIRGALQHGTPIRVESGILLPSRQGAVSLTGLPGVSSDLPGLIAEKSVEVAELRQQLESRYGYDLLQRNCVTELLRALNTAFPDPEIERRELGGRLEPDKGLNFIPTRFYAAVREEFPVHEERVLPSRRLRRVAVLYEEDDLLSTWLRESNTVTSTLYAARVEDTPFLFFTDNAFLLRPVLGITNFCWAAVSSLTGILTLPLDGGKRIHQGLRGMFYSLPELAFNNIRKGTYGFAATAAVGP